MTTGRINQIDTVDTVYTIDTVDTAATVDIGPLVHRSIGPEQGANPRIALIARIQPGAICFRTNDRRRIKQLKNSH